MTPKISSDAAQRALLWTLGAVFLAVCVHSNGGRYSPEGMICLSLAIAAIIFASLAPREMAFDSRRVLNTVLAASATFFAAFWIVPDSETGRPLAIVGSLVGCALVAAILARLAKWPLLRKTLFPIFLILQLVLGASTIFKAGQWEKNSSELKFHVSNDVQIFNEEAARLLLSGQNPYSVRMPNVMGADYPFYPPNVTGADGRLPFGYVYMPLSALWSLPGHLIGDFRYTHLIAVLGAALFLAYARPSVTSQLAATVFLLFPSALFVLVMSWTEPIAVFFLAATLFCFYRAPKWLFLSLGCLICAKQYTVFLLPILPLLVPQREKLWPLIGKSVAVALILTLPMAVWDIDGFFRSAVQMQFKQPFRHDSLSYLVTVLKWGGPQLSPILGFAALLVGLVWSVKKMPRVASSWCGAGALAFLGFFALNKQAFANYYFWVFGLLIAAVAVALPPEDHHEENG
ncbi:MAG TPA: hypothetical protein VGB45_11080 [Abditibacterium sp.]|jgi:hypothetical protein